MLCHISVAVNLEFGSRCFKGCVTFRRFKLQVPLKGTVKLPSLPLTGKLPVASRFARYASRVLVKRFSQFSNCTSVLCYPPLTEKFDVFLVFVYANIFERMSLSL